MKKLFAIFIIIIYSTLNILAQQHFEHNKTVRVGWYESAYNHKDNNGRRTGYAYDYQLRISANNAWNYEYVEGSWIELFEKLQKGEIDLLAHVTYVPEREKEILYSANPMGTEEYLIIALAENTSIKVGEPQSLNGKSVGVLKNSFQYTKLLEWKKEHDVDINILEFELPDDQFYDLLDQGVVDAVATLPSFNPLAKITCIPIVNIGSSNIYFGINKNKPELKNELDRAMSRIRSHNIYYNRDLHEKYFGSSTIFRYLPDAECKWVEEHGVIRIAYRDNYLPFCSKETFTGQLTGFLRDYIDNVNGSFANVDIKLEAVPYPSFNSAIDAVLRGEVDAAFPNGIGNFDSEQMHLLSTDAFINSSEMAVVRNDDNFHTTGNIRIAINSEDPNYMSWIYENYPEWEIVHFPSTYECLKGISNGQADLLLISNYRLGVLNDVIEKLGLKAVATGTVIPLGFAISDENTILYSIMNRLSHVMSRSEIYGALARYSEVTREVTFADFLKQHVLGTMLFFVVILLAIIFLLIRSRQEHKRAKSANQAKTRFLFNMSHDIRTPMNAIMGYTELLKDNFDNKSKREDYLDKIKSSGSFLLGLINNVLEVARIESGKTEVKNEPMLIGSLLGDLMLIYVDLFEKKGVAFEFSSAVKTKAIYCDIVKLNEIYLNILSNAYKYTPKGGKVSVKTRDLPGDKDGYIKIECIISDTGIGMSKDYLPHLFEDFTREQTYTDNKISGTGLGMAIVKKLVTLLGGTITVDSELGKGTTFVITIQHQIADEKLLEEKSMRQDIKTDFSGKNVLLVEDNELNAEIAMEILKNSGFSVEHAYDGNKCIKMLEEHPSDYYDLILMDIQMPVLNGYEATIKIRCMGDSVKAHIPIIALTANAFEEDKLDALNAGMNGHLSKPIEVQKLQEELSRIIK